MARLIAAALLAAGLVLLPAPPAGAAGKTVRIGLDSYPTRLDPRFATDASSNRFTQLAFSGLVRREPDASLVPDLAASWEMPSPREYLFRLKKGLRFHDGTPLTADDVVFTFTSILDPAVGSPKRGAFAAIESVKAEDPATVRFVLKHPSAPFLTDMILGIVPRRAASNAAAFAAKPVGAGPFTFVSAVADARVELAANPGWHGGKPKIDTIVLVAIPEETVRVLALRKGDLDFIQNGIPAEMVPAFERDPRYRVVKRPGSNHSYLGLNLRDPILGKLPVRRALAMALDRGSIIKHLLGGYAEIADGLLPPENWAFSPGVKQYPHDPKGAARLLDEAGYRDPDGEGPKTRFTLTYKTSQSELGKRIGEVIQDQWRHVGVGLTIRSFEWGTFYNDIKAGNFQLYRLEWVGVTDPDIYHNVLHSSMTPPNGANRGFFADPEMDRLLVAGRETLDTAGRKQAYAAVQRMAAEALPAIPLWHATNVIVMRKELAGFVPFPAGDFTSFAAADWVPAK